MNCFFCQSDLTNYRTTGLSRPAGTFQCVTCAKTNSLKRVVVTINTKQEPLEAILYVDDVYHFRVDFYAKKSYLTGPRQPLGIKTDLLVLPDSNITPQNAKSKMKTYLIFL